MAKTYILPVGKHKPVVSSWQSLDHAYGKELMPSRENTEYFCYQSGQAKAMAREYESRKKAIDIANAMAILDSML